MYIRKTNTRKNSDGSYYSTFRLAASERVPGKVKQRTILNIGSCFEVAEHLWPQLCKRIEDILRGSSSLLPLESEIEQYAQDFAARIIAECSDVIGTEGVHDREQFEEVDADSLELTRPRSVGVEHLALSAIIDLGLSEIIQAAGFTQTQHDMALAGIVGRMAKPGSEAATWERLTTQSALGELMGVDFLKYSAMGLYRASDKLLEHKKSIEDQLFSRISSLFSLEETITLYDLTNTYFEGEARANAKAARGFSKEKRFDCPLMTLGLVLDGSGFVKKSMIFEGNAAEASTVESMLEKLKAPSGALVVMDRGIASQAAIDWLVSANYRYVVVSRERNRIFDPDKAQTIVTAQQQDLQIYRELDGNGTEARLYCYSPGRAAKEEGIAARFAGKLEAGLSKLAASLGNKRVDRRKDVVLQRIGRLIEKSHGVGRHYRITVEDNAAAKSEHEPLLATAIHFEKKIVAGSMLANPGVYCIRTNATWLEAEDLWRTYTMLTDLEAVFRSLKSELGLRPVYHQTTDRCEGHLFITVLAYQCVQAIRIKLKGHEINDSWQTLRTIAGGQHRISATFRQRNGMTLHIRKATVAENRQQLIYTALGLDNQPGGVTRHTVAIPNTNV